MVKVYSDNASPSLWKVLIAAKYANVNVESQVGNLTKETTALSPLGKLPFIETDDKTVIYGDNAVLRYVARLGKGHLYGSNDVEAGLIEQFVAMSATEIDLPASVWIFPILGQVANNVQATQRAKIDINKILGYLNKHLATRTYLVGERITIADIAVSMSLYHLYQKVLDTNTRKGFVNTNRWFTTLVNQPNFKAVVGETTLCSKQEVAPENFTPKKEEKPKKEETKKEQPKKEEKPKPKKEEKPAEEEEDEFAEKEDKKPNILDSLPPSKMNMDEWKRTYSNKDTRSEAIPWFWQNLDLEGYSLWFCDYKYNNECEKTFMTCNLLGGWIQRLDKLRKYGFGSLCIFGQEPNLSVAGAWLFRGKEIPQEMKETDDSEHYEWRRVDINNSADKALVEDFWAWDGNFGGRSFNQGKIFK